MELKPMDGYAKVSEEEEDSTSLSFPPPPSLSFCQMSMTQPIPPEEEADIEFLLQKDMHHKLRKGNCLLPQEENKRQHDLQLQFMFCRCLVTKAAVFVFPFFIAHIIALYLMYYYFHPKIVYLAWPQLLSFCFSVAACTLLLYKMLHSLFVFRILALSGSMSPEQKIPLFKTKTSTTVMKWLVVFYSLVYLICVLVGVLFFVDKDIHILSMSPTNYSVLDSTNRSAEITMLHHAFHFTAVIFIVLVHIGLFIKLIRTNLIRTTNLFEKAKPKCFYSWFGLFTFLTILVGIVLMYWGNSLLIPISCINKSSKNRGCYNWFDYSSVLFEFILSLGGCLLTLLTCLVGDAYISIGLTWNNRNKLFQKVFSNWAFVIYGILGFIFCLLFSGLLTYISASYNMSDKEGLDISILQKNSSQHTGSVTSLPK
ncbi:hypothetical protein NECID01_1386 [Nematocida sp. AWRm77]|nr:hypothetical protein NECID01_1386 [Nematocida sp. AWRm77]